MADAERYAQTFLRIRNKSKDLVSFRANEQQRRLWAVKRALRQRGMGVRMLILKARQMGVTTLEQLDSYHKSARMDGRGDGATVLTLAHDNDTTEEIFQIAQRAHEQHRAAEFRPHRPWSNKRELHFPHLDSTFGVRTAGATAVGHGMTISKVHGSEVAYWKHAVDVQTGLNEAVPADGEIVFESTPNGAAGLFYELCQQAKEANGIITLRDPIGSELDRKLENLGRGGRSRWLLMFFPWFEFAEYAVELQSPDELGALYPKEELLVEAYGLTLEQLKFRRLKVADYQGTEEIFDQEYPSDPVTCFLLSGRRIFNVAALSEALARCRPPERELTLYDGVLRIWRDFEEGHRYVIGGDTSEGVAGGNYGSLDVFDAGTWEQVATFHGLPSPHDLAVMVDLLGRGGGRYGLENIRGYASPRHGPPLAVVESNNTGHAVLSTLINEIKYPRRALYHRTHYADPERKKAEVRVGWDTNSASRWVLLNELGQGIYERVLQFNDRETVMELLTFQLDEKDRPGAPEGAHDDRVFSAGLAFQGRRYKVATGDWTTTTREDPAPEQNKRTW